MIQRSTESFAGRLDLVLSGESVSAFGRKSGVSESLLRKYLDGSEPGITKLVAIAEAAGVSVEWLATGIGPTNPTDKIGGGAVAHAADDYVHVPRYDVQASAGPGAVVHSEQIVDFLAFRAGWLRASGLQPDALALIEAAGDSMEPTIRAGDLLLVDLTRRHPGEGIYILRAEDQLLAKRLQVVPGGALYIRSDNPAYSTLEVPGDETLHVLGRVAWTIRRA